MNEFHWQCKIDYLAHPDAFKKKAFMSDENKAPSLCSLRALW